MTELSKSERRALEGIAQSDDPARSRAFIANACRQGSHAVEQMLLEACGKTIRSSRTNVDITKITGNAKGS